MYVMDYFLYELRPFGVTHGVDRLPGHIKFADVAAQAKIESEANAKAIAEKQKNG